MADGWSITHIFAGEDWAEFYDYDYSDENPTVAFLIQKPLQVGLDALAAQLVRQVDALDRTWIEWGSNGGTSVFTGNLATPIAGSYKSDRTMNTIKAIVDSGVLDE